MPGIPITHKQARQLRNLPPLNREEKLKKIEKGEAKAKKMARSKRIDVGLNAVRQRAFLFKDQPQNIRLITTEIRALVKRQKALNEPQNAFWSNVVGKSVDHEYHTNLLLRERLFRKELFPALKKSKDLAIVTFMEKARQNGQFISVDETGHIILINTGPSFTNPWLKV